MAPPTAADTAESSRHCHDLNSASQHSSGPSVPRVFGGPRSLTALTPAGAADSSPALYEPLDPLLGGRFRADLSQHVPNLPPLQPSIFLEANSRVDSDAVNAQIRAAKPKPKALKHTHAAVSTHTRPSLAFILTIF